MDDQNKKLAPKDSPKDKIELMNSEAEKVSGGSRVPRGGVPVKESKSGSVGLLGTRRKR